MTSDDRAREAAEHLQAAALELIAVARVVLDGIEELVRDPGPVVAVVAAAAARGRAAAGAPSTAHGGTTDGAGGGVPQRPRVERIRVS